MTVTNRIEEMLSEELATADSSFGREPVNGVYPLYQKYVELVGYPYIQAVENWIIEQYPACEQYREKLHHEIYLASQQAREDKTVQRATEMKNKGYVRADENLEVGQVYELVRYSDSSILSGAGLTEPQRVRFIKDAENTPFLMPTRNKRRGYVVGYSCEYWVKNV